jgi:hypothetical protein
MRGHVKEIFKKIFFSFTWRRMDAGPRESFLSSKNYFFKVNT